MKHVVKEGEPRALTEFRLRDRGAPFDAAPKNDLRKALLAEQHRQCCYCMQTIAPGRMRIEHWLPRSSRPDLTLDWRNLFGACRGGEGSANPHCDVSKGNATITLNPSEHPERRTFYRFASGQIAGRDDDATADLQTLNLNAPQLRDARKAALNSFQHALSRKYTGTFPRTRLIRELQRAERSTGPWSGVLVAWLKRKLQGNPTL